MSEDAAATPTEASSVIILDEDPGERDRIEAMAEELGVEIWAATPEDLVPERSDAWESLAQARAVVVAARFGSRTGLEIIQLLAWSSGPRPRVTALGLERPHRAWIEAASRAGATTCVMHPFEAEELAEKVIAPSASPAEEETVDEASNARPDAEDDA